MSVFDRGQGSGVPRRAGSGVHRAVPMPGAMRAADAVLALQRRAGNRAVGATLARKVEMRDVGRGDASSVDVVTSDGTVYTPADYLAMLDFAAEHP